MAVGGLAASLRAFLASLVWLLPSPSLERGLSEGSWTHRQPHGPTWAACPEYVHIGVHRAPEGSSEGNEGPEILKIQRFVPSEGLIGRPSTAGVSPSWRPCHQSAREARANLMGLSVSQ